MKLPATLLLTYRTEYETTPGLTLSELCDRYNIKLSDLKDTSKWFKRCKAEPKPLVIPRAVVAKLDTIIAPPAEDKPLVMPTVELKTREQMLMEVNNFKALALTHALKFISCDAEFAEVKELKDMVSIVDTIERSYKDASTSPHTVSSAIKNLVEEFRDDC